MGYVGNVQNKNINQLSVDTQKAGAEHKHIMQYICIHSCLCEKRETRERHDRKRKDVVVSFSSFIPSLLSVLGPEEWLYFPSVHQRRLWSENCVWPT